MAMGVFPLTSLGFGSVPLKYARKMSLRSVLGVVWLGSLPCFLLLETNSLPASACKWKSL